MNTDDGNGPSSLIAAVLLGVVGMLLGLPYSAQERQER